MLAPGRQLAFALRSDRWLAHSLSWQGPSIAIVMRHAGFTQQMQALGETPGLGLSQCFIV